MGQGRVRTMGTKALLIHPSHQGVCWRHDTEDSRVTPVKRHPKYCEGFRMTAHPSRREWHGAVVRKPPGKEPAGSWGDRAVRRAMAISIRRGGLTGPGEAGDRLIQAPDRRVRLKGAAVSRWSRAACDVIRGGGQQSGRAAALPVSDRREGRVMMRQVICVRDHEVSILIATRGAVGR